jgi:hypothetical protein
LRTLRQRFVPTSKVARSASSAAGFAASTPRIRRALASACIVAVTCAACSSAGGTGTTTRPSATRPSTTISYVTVNGKRLQVPTERPGRPISPVSDVGQQIVILNGHLYPKTLYAFRNKPIVWTNLTDRSIRVLFSHFPLSRGSGVIAPGGSFSYTVHNNTVINYSLTSGAFGNVAVSILPSTNPP